MESSANTKNRPSSEKEDRGIRGPQYGSRQPPEFYCDKSPTNIREFEEHVLKGRPLFTREYIEAAVKQRDQLKGDWVLDWQRSYAMSKYPEKYPPDHIQLHQPPIYNEIGSMESVEEIVEDLRKRWRESTMCAHLVKLLLETTDDMPKIDKILCIGLGSFSSSPEWFPGYRSQFPHWLIDKSQRDNILQHLAAVTVASTLNEMYEKNIESSGIRIYAQDPGYSETDRSILSSLDISVEIIDDPEGFLAIDESTFIITSLCAAPVYEIMADLTASAHCGRGSAAFIADKLILASEEPIEYVGARNRETPRVMEFLENYELRGFDDFVVPCEEFKELWEQKTGDCPWWWRLEMRIRKVQETGGSRLIADLVH